MPQMKHGTVTAYIPPGKGKSQGHSVTVGNLFKRDDGTLSFKIDSLPLPGSGWDGWCNIRKEGDPVFTPRDKDKPASKSATDPFDDDTPF